MKVLGKTDRYGKKYSWIAFYEMAGYRNDLGFLKEWKDEAEFGISDADIDPSFPVELRQYNLFKELGDKSLILHSSKNWIKNNENLGFNEYLELKNSLGVEDDHEWVLLKGSFTQKDEKRGNKRIHAAISAILVDENNHKSITELVGKWDDYSFEYPRNREDHYTFGGETPWCSLIPGDYAEKISISHNYHDVAKTRQELKILNKGKREF